MLIACSLSILPAGGLAGCDESDVIALRLTVQEDGSGTVIVNSVQMPDTPGPVEQAARGAAWSHRVNVIAASGAFDDLAALRVAEIQFERGSTGPHEGYVQVTLPLGPEARWPRILAAAEPEELEAASRTIDPTGKVKLGKVVKIVLSLPGRVVAQGTQPETRQIRTKVHDAPASDGGDGKVRENRMATLVVPLGMARAASGTLTWHVMWSQ